ncbi:MAG: DUF1700 domain-containing protein [Clostridiales bacterium]|jgi:uncharacterized membrane protein|nr:DUF1700 domain-containing protein [Clostridiales bacterium]MBR4495427.1 DUF1700 domain-containing protein [Clostridiales bacterium]
MNKAEFLNELRTKLNGLPQNDIEERVSFYTEMIDDRVEDGMSEEEAIEQIGPVDKVVETIVSEIPLSKIVKAKVKPQKKMPVWAIVLLVLGFPVWFPILISLVSVIFSVYLTLWIIVITLYAVDLSLAVASIASIASAFVAFIGGEPLVGLASIGSFMVCGALSVLMFFGCGYVVKGVVFVTRKMLLGIKSWFIGKEN